MTENVAELVVKLVDQLAGPAKSMGIALGGLQKDVARLNGTFVNFGAAAKKSFAEAQTALMGTAVAAGAFYLAIKKPIEQAMEFNSVLKTLQIQTGRTEEQMKTIGERFGALSSKLHISAQTIAQVATTLPKSFRDSNDQMLKVLETTGKFSRAWDMDMGAAVKAITPLNKLVGLTADQLDYAFSMMTRASKEANMPITQLTESLPRLALEMKSLHASGASGFASTLSWITAMTKNTGDLSSSMSDYEKVMQKVFNPAFGKGTGFSIRHLEAEARATGKDIGLLIARDLEKIIMSRGPGAEKEMATKLFGGKMFALAYENFRDAAKDIIRIQKELKESQGELNNAFLERISEWGESWRGLAIEIAGFGRAIGQILGTNLAPLVDHLKDAVTATKEWAVANDKWVTRGVEFAGALLAVSGGVAAIRVAIWGVVTALTALSAHPLIGLIIGAAGGIAAFAQSPSHVLGGSGFDAARRLFGSGGAMAAPAMPGGGANPYGALYGPGKVSPTEAATGPWRDMSGKFSDFKQPLESIDHKMSDLIDTIRYSGPGGTAGGGIGGGGGSGGGRGRFTSGPQGSGGGRGRFGAGGGDTPGKGPVSVGKGGDPRGLEAYIREQAAQNGVDPDTAVRVAKSEGLGTFLGDHGKSGGAFQLYTGGGLGNQFQKETGLNPLDPKNEKATIAWAMKYVGRTHDWSPWHGAKRTGVGAHEGFGYKGGPGTVKGGGGSSGGAGASSDYAGSGAAGGTPLSYAQQMMGRRPSDADLRAYMSGTGLDPRKQAWCAAFVSASLEKAGIKPTSSKTFATDYLNWGTHVDPKDVRAGDIMVMGRHGGRPQAGAQGHIGIVEGTDADGNVRTIEGNTGGAVQERTEPIGRGEYRRAPEHQSKLDMKPNVDDEHMDDAIKKLERMHHLAKTMPNIKMATSEHGDDHTHRYRTALNNRWGSANEVQGG